MHAEQHESQFSRLRGANIDAPLLCDFGELSENKRIVLIGGSFDPPHVGHLRLGEVAAQSLHADAVLYMPAARNPLKENCPSIADSDRIELLRKCLANHENFLVSPFEIEQGGKSYTVETVRALRRAVGPVPEICLVIGADCLTRLHQWKEISDLLELATIYIGPRRGFPVPSHIELSKTLGDKAAQTILNHILPIDEPAISSTEIRAMLQSGSLPRAWVPERALEYIQEKHLYSDHKEGQSRPISLDSLYVVRRLSKFELQQQQLGLKPEELLKYYRSAGIDSSPILACHESLQRATAHLERLLGVGRVLTRDQFSPECLPQASVVIALGGDDHLKYICQSIEDQLVLAVNPDPWRSDGALTSCMSEELPEVLEALMSGQYAVEDWTRIEVFHDGKSVGRALSEVRLSEDDVDDMSHHRLCQGNECAEQKGSGLIVATGAGTTGWYNAASRYQFPAGNSLSRTSQIARYILREPHEGRLLGRKMWSGDISSANALRVESLNDGAASVSFDAVRRLPFPRGMSVEIGISNQPLKIIKPKQ